MFENLFSLLANMGLAIVLVMITIMIHYEALRLTSDWLPRLEGVPPRPKMILVILTCFAAHTVEVWVWAVAYSLLTDVLRIGRFSGEPLTGLDGYLYYSVVTYTSLGFGDTVPIGGARLLSGVEALTGLLLIGWSGSFTFLEMAKLWDGHSRRRNKAGSGAKRGEESQE